MYFAPLRLTVSVLLAFLFLASSIVTAQENIPASELNALWSLYNATDGANWVWYDPSEPQFFEGAVWNFSLQANPCSEQWQGVTCNESSIALNTSHVCNLTLPFHGLQGSLSAEIGQLTQLQVLDLASNNLRGSIPAEIGQLTQLLHLDLFHNRLSHSIPVEIGQLTLLQYLDFNDNRLAGSIPAEIGQLAQLQYMDIDFNKLSGSIPPEVGQMGQLQLLSLDYTGLTGSIPAEIGQLTQLIYLDLASNELSGRVPAEIGQLTQLQYLYLTSNSLSGDILMVMGQLTQLQDLDLSENKLSGSIPTDIGQLTQLQVMFLDTNRMSGSIPAEIGQLTQLLVLNLGLNQLSGSVPPEMGQLTQLEVLATNTNMLSGSIPSAIGQLASLRVLLMLSNKLSGSIPKEIGQLTQLRYIGLSSNTLSGTIPAEIGHLAKLHMLDLDANALSGCIPAEIGQLTRLSEMQLDSNALSGSIPAEIGQLAELRVLHVVSNELSGSIPEEIGLLTNLQYVDVHSNVLSGGIPEIGLLAQLQYLDLGTNELFGSILSDIGNLTSLQFLDLGRNVLSGSVPADIGLLVQLQYLDLHANRLSGSIPLEIGQLTLLQVLDLDTNALSGGILAEIGQLALLEYLNIADNALTGSLLDELFVIGNLSALIAGKNCFEGTLPQAVCGATALVSLNLDGLHTARQCSKRQVPFTYIYGGAEAIHGTIPNCIFSLPLLTSLHLSGNGLTGTIPANLSADALLTDLVLSHNSLVGPIPVSIQLRAWDTLDLSYNRLEGTLLTGFGDGGQIWGNASASVYLKNNRLSGRIPSAVIHLTNVDILGSNIFSCDADRSDLPENDEDKDRYQCGSDVFVGHLIAALAVLMVIVVSLWLLRGWRCGGQLDLVVNFAEKWLWDAKVSAAILPPGVQFLSNAGALLCDVAVWCALAAVICLIPWYAAAHSQYSTYTHAYAWVVSAAFLSGMVPAVIELALYCALMMAVVIGGAMMVARSVGSAGQQSTAICSDQPSTSSAGSTPTPLWYPKFLYALFFVTNLTVVLLVNVGFVAASLQADHAVLTIAQILYTVFKLLWNMLCTPYMIDVITAHTGRRRVSSSMVTVHMFLSIINNIAIPCLVVAAQSPSCFLNVFQASPTVHAEYDVPGCSTFTVASVSGSIFATACSSRYSVPLSLQFEPHFSYSYQCSSSFITYYSPVFVLMGLTAGVLIPGAKAGSLYCLTRAVPGTRWHQILSAAVPRILRPIPTSSAPPPSDQETLPVTPAAMLRQLREDRIFDGVTAVSAMITYLGILLTFGVVFPPLAVIMCATMWSVYWQMRLMLGKFVHDAQAAGAVHLIERLEQDCRSVVSLQTLRRVMFLITCICCCFYALFLFDTLGDARGAADSYWIFLVMALFPVVLYSLNCLLQAFEGKLGTTGRSDDGMFEMATIISSPAQQVEEGSSLEVTAAAGKKGAQSVGVARKDVVIGATMNALHSSA